MRTLPIRRMLPLALLLVLTPCSSFMAQGFAPRPSHFWVDCPSTSDMFDDQMLQFIGRHGAFFIPHVNVELPIPFYNLRSIIERSHHWNPGMPVLQYSYLSIGDSSSKRPNFLPDHFLQGYELLDTLLLRDSQGNLLRSPLGGLLGDVRSATYRNWVLSRVADSMRTLGFDGVMSDSYRVSGHVAAPALCKTGAEPFCAEYAQGMLDLTAQLKAAIAPKPFIFNGLLNIAPYSDEQWQALGMSDGATVEFFGYSQYSGDSSFTDQILPFLVQLRDHPQQRVFVCGRGYSTPYTDFLDDYQRQRYLFGCYLLGMNQNTTFHYFTDFAIPSGISGRCGPLDYCEDQNLEPGEAVDAYFVSKGLYTREFSRGWVAVLPDDATAAQVVSIPGLPGMYFDPAGEEVSGARTLQPGEALLLFSSPPRPHEAVVKDFERADEATATWQSASILQEGGNHFLHTDPLPPGNRNLHDMMLDWIRAERNFTTMSLRARTNDAKAQLLVVADVDDPAKRYMRAVISVPLNGAQESRRLDSLFLFRVQRIQAAGPNQRIAPYIPAPGIPAGDGQWHTLHLDGDSILAGTGLTFRRFAFMRIVGAVDLDDVVLPDSSAATGIETMAPRNCSMEVFPNPASESAVVVLRADRPFEAWLDLYDGSGKLICKLFGGQPGVGGRTVSLPIKELPAGNYWIRESGDRMAPVRFIVR